MIMGKQSNNDADSRKASDGWDDDDPIGKQRQRLVKWLMKYPRCVPLEKAKIIASRKYRY